MGKERVRERERLDTQTDRQTGSINDPSCVFTKLTVEQLVIVSAVIAGLYSSVFKLSVFFFVFLFSVTCFCLKKGLTDDIQAIILDI